MKTCSRCGIKKELVAFSKKTKGKLQSYCKACHSIYLKVHYQSNKKAYATASRASTARVRKLSKELKNQPCMDCGGTFPSCVMDWDHTRGTKRAAVPSLATYGKKAVLAEISKCDLVCANCHRIRTHITRKRV